jgi:putative peptide zinc metalloprotease protein
MVEAGLVNGASLFSEYWYRIAELKPQLQPHAKLSRHRYRDRDWWVIADPVSSRQHRVSENGYFLLSHMDGKRTVEEIWDLAVARLGEQVPTQDDFLGLLGQLHSADLLLTDIGPDADELFQRKTRRRRNRQRQQWVNPLFLRFNLMDPDKLLEKLARRSDWLFNKPVYALWLVAVLCGFAGAVVNAPEIWRQAADIVFVPANLVIMLFVFAGMKLVHEIGHGLAVKRWGGDVHEAGMMLLVLVPIPFLDASAASGFEEKRKRIYVSAAGIIIELFLASLGLLVWYLTEPGLLNVLGLDLFLIGAVSSLLFNGNPLMRFDGYFIFADFIEIPNLAQRSKSYISYLMRSIFVGRPGAGEIPATTSEKAWLVSYGIASSVYRLVILLSIALFVSTKFFIVGALLALWTVGSLILYPTLKGLVALLQRTNLVGQRFRVLAMAGAVAGLSYVLLFAIAFPRTTDTQAIVWLQEESVVRPRNDCFVSEMLVKSGTWIEEGTTLLRCRDEELTAKVELLKGRIDATRSEYQGVGIRDAFKRKIIADDLRSLVAEYELLVERLNAQIVVANNSGTYVVADQVETLNRYYPNGSTIGFILNPDALAIRAVVDQDSVDLVRNSSSKVEVRFADSPDETHASSIDVELPASTDMLPSIALGSRAGGPVLTDPKDDTGLRAQNHVYLFDLNLPDGMAPERIGGRVHVRFQHGSAPLAKQWGRYFRLQFLRQFDV